MDEALGTLHDCKRGLAVAWNQGELHQVAGVPADITSLLHQEELAYQRLWRTLTRSLAVPERTNPVLQRRCMPRRYWKCLIENPGDAFGE